MPNTFAQTETTLRHSYPFIRPGQSLKYLTFNTAMQQLDTLQNLCLSELGANTPPSDPVIGACYDVGPKPKEAFEAHRGKLAAFLEEGWYFFDKVKGMTALNLTTGEFLIFDGSNWKSSAGADQVQSLGINTSADLTNRLAVKSDAVLFAANDSETSEGNVRVVLSKTDADDTASLLYQKSYTSYVEAGLLGDNNYTIQVSADGTTFIKALEINSQTGAVGLGKRPSHALDILKSDSGVARMKISNPSTAPNAGSATTLSAGNGKFLDVTLYHQGTAYMVSNSSVMYYQLTGKNPLHRFYLGSFEALSIAQKRITLNAPAKLANRTLATLPSASESGPGAIIYVSDSSTGGVIAYSDGANWRRSSDMEIVT